MTFIADLNGVREEKNRDPPKPKKKRNYISVAITRKGIKVEYDDSDEEAFALLTEQLMSGGLNDYIATQLPPIYTDLVFLWDEEPPCIPPDQIIE